jgi:flagellar biogenesis protein FliO
MVKKINLLICIAVLCSGICAFASEQDCCLTTNSDAESASEQTYESFFDSGFDGGGENDARHDLTKRFFYVISFVAILGIAAYYLTKKLLPKLTITQGKIISVSETVHLGPQKQLHLIHVGHKRKFLIGSTNENINIIADVTDTLTEKLEEST